MSNYRCNNCNERCDDCVCTNSSCPRSTNIMLIDQIEEAVNRLNLTLGYHHISDLIKALEAE